MSLLSPDFVDELRGRDSRELLATYRSTCAVLGVFVAILTALTHAALGDEVFVAALVAIAVTAHLGVRSTLRPSTALRGVAILLFGLAVAVAIYLTDVGLFWPKPLVNFKWPPFVSPALTTYATALVVAVWLPNRARYLTWIVGALAGAWEVFLLAHVLF